MALNTKLNRAAYFETKLECIIGPVELKKMIDEDPSKIQIVDARSSKDFQQAHIPGALNIELADLEEKISELNLELDVIVYCYDDVCNLASKLCLELAHNGFNVRELNGSFAEWKKRDFPTS